LCALAEYSDITYNKEKIMQNPRTRKHIKDRILAGTDKQEVAATIALMILCALLAIVAAITFEL
jgi:hypothetical protein